MPALFYRDAVLEEDVDDAIDVDRGRARLSFASEAPVEREDPAYGGIYREVLSMHSSDFKTAKLARNGPVLFNHDPSTVIGDVVSVRMRSDRKAEAQIVIYPEHRSYLARIVARDAPNAVSFGYNRLSVLKIEQGTDGIKTVTFASEALEISLLQKGHPAADVGVGFGRSKSFRSQNMKSSFDEILAAALSGSRQTDNDFSDVPIADFLEEKSFNRGRVREAQQLAPKIIGGCWITGRWLPFSMLNTGQRDMTSSVFSAGGSLIQANMLPVVAPLAVHTCAIRNGCTVITGVSGTVVLPRQTSMSTIQALGETAAVTQSGATFDQVPVAPKRACVQIPISKQLLLQAREMDGVLKAEFARRISIELDRQILYGALASEALGIINTPGTGSIVFGGAATWANVVAFEKALTDSNADEGNLGWAVSGATRNKWKQASKIVSTNFPSFIMEGGEANEYPVAVSNNLAATHQCIFGNWSDLLLLIWGDGAEVIVDPYTAAVKGETLYTVNFWFSTALRHAQSFCVSADSAAQ